MAKTETDLVQRVLSRLGVAGVGQTTTAEDSELVLSAAHSSADELGATGDLVISNLDSIEDVYFLAFADYVAIEVAADFGIGEAELAAKGIARDGVMRRINRLVAVPYTGDVMKADYY